jgi:hypothetical protein
MRESSPFVPRRPVGASIAARMVMKLMFAAATCGALLFSGCSSPPTSSPDGKVTLPDDAPHEDAPAKSALAAFCGGDAQPFAEPVTNHADLTSLLRTLPTPVGLPCLLAALPRPVAIVGSKNVVSAQPAAGPQNPRVFVQPPGGLILSITLAGEASTHLETAEAVADAAGYSIKGDLTFPLTGCAERDFFADIVTTKYTGTACGGCHAGEYEVRKVDGIPAFASRALKPSSTQRVPMLRLRELAEACSAEDTTERCLMLRALFREPASVAEMQWNEETKTFN